MMIIILLSPISSAGIFDDYDHKPIPTCYYCHINKGFSIGQYNDGESCDNCHNIKDNIQNLEKSHSNICSKCHATPRNDGEYHDIHKGIDCAKCHGTGILPVKPTTGVTNCATCHGAVFSGGNNIHITHKSRLEEICTRCHGSRPPSNPSGIEIQSPSSEKTDIDIVKEIDNINKKIYAKVIDYKRYTLYEIFKIIFAAFH